MKRISLVIASLAVAVLGATAAFSLNTASTPAGQDLDQAWSLEQESSLHKKWKTQNPGEATKLESYWTNAGTAPTLATFHGQAWVKVKDAQIKIEAVTTTAPTTTTNPPPPPPPPAGSANVWVDSNGGTCVRSTTLIAYNDSTACSSFASAYTAASSGDTVGVTGSIGVQKFAGGYQATQGPGTKTLMFKGIPGNKVRQIQFASPNLTFDGIDVDAGATKTSGAAFENGGAPFTFKNGRIGNVVDEKGALVTEAGIVFDNVEFHDVVLRTNGVHNECIFAAVPDGMIIRNSRFRNCAVMDLFFVYPDWWPTLPPPYKNVTLENNDFDKPVGTYAIYIGKIGTSIANSAPITGWRVRNNNFDGPINTDAPYGTNNIFCGNTATVSGVPDFWKVPC